MGRVEVNGTSLFCVEAGSGPALLFVHGMAGSADVWSDQMARLQDSFRVVAYDRRGHTRSPRGDAGPESVELHADDAAEIIVALGLAPVILVGSSGGARICIDVLRRHSALVRRAVLSEPPVFSLSPPIGEAFMHRVKPVVGEALDGKDRTLAVDAFFSVIDPGMWDGLAEARKQAYRANLPAMMADLQMPTYQLTAADLAGIEQPCLVLSGANSLPWFQEIARIVAENLPKGSPKMLPGAGHATYATQPAAFAAAVREFANSAHDDWKTSGDGGVAALDP